jgi:1-deoxy-D-xylulose-5-phosphate reductoisomerase
MAQRKRIGILGSTGSIGRQTLEVIATHTQFEACALAAGCQWELLAEQARRFAPEAVAIADDSAAEPLAAAVPDGTRVLAGPDAMTRLVHATRPDVLMTGVVGAAGLKPTLAGIECGCAMAIANKETLVTAGAVVMPAARDAGVEVLPVDSEHSGIFQCLKAGRRADVRRVTITASGGALRDFSADEAHAATVREALNHPTWEMGRKITIDSATLMNKALEVVEAHWLFDLAPEQIEVVIHPESIVHALVEFADGSVVAQLARPDMTTPIAYALSYPERLSRPEAAFDLGELGRLTFRPLEGRFARAVALGYEAVRRGGTAGAVLNGANEAAVEAFLVGEIAFGDIVPAVEQVLNRARWISEVTLDALLSADAWARARVAEIIGAAVRAPSA